MVLYFQSGTKQNTKMERCFNKFEKKRNKEDKLPTCITASPNATPINTAAWSVTQSYNDGLQPWKKCY